MKMSFSMTLGVDMPFVLNTLHVKWINFKLILVSINEYKSRTFAITSLKKICDQISIPNEIYKCDSQRFSVF